MHYISINVSVGRFWDFSITLAHRTLAEFFILGSNPHAAVSNQRQVHSLNSLYEIMNVYLVMDSGE